MNESSVLIVDRDDRTARTAQEVLSHMCNNNIISVSTIESAENILYNENILFLIIDLSFGNIEGIELIKAIRHSKNGLNNKMPILVILERNCDKNTKNIITDAGAVDFIATPFGNAALQKAILHILNNPRNFIDCGVYVGPDRRSKNLSPKIDLRKSGHS